MTMDEAYASETVRRFFDATGPFADIMRAANLPPGMVIIQRINLGLYAILGELHATANWRRIAEELWPFVEQRPVDRARPSGGGLAGRAPTRRLGERIHLTPPDPGSVPAGARESRRGRPVAEDGSATARTSDHEHGRTGQSDHEGAEQEPATEERVRGDALAARTTVRRLGLFRGHAAGRAVGVDERVDPTGEDEREWCPAVLHLRVLHRHRRRPRDRPRPRPGMPRRRPSTR